MPHGLLPDCPVGKAFMPCEKGVRIIWYGHGGPCGAQCNHCASGDAQPARFFPSSCFASLWAYPHVIAHRRPSARQLGRLRPLPRPRLAGLALAFPSPSLRSVTGASRMSRMNLVGRVTQASCKPSHLMERRQWPGLNWRGFRRITTCKPRASHLTGDWWQLTPAAG